MKTTLTDRFVMGAQAETQERYFDNKTRGLVLRTGTRRKVWYFAYRFAGADRWLRLGEYPGITLAGARLLVNEYRTMLDKGIDPAAEQERAIAAATPAPTPPVFTFADFVPVYIGFQKGRTKSWEDEAGKIYRHLLPTWGPLPLREIKRPQVVELLDTVVSKGLTAGVNRIQALISRMFTVALNRGLVEAHPAARLIKHFKETARDRVLTDVELRALWAGLETKPGAAADAVRLRLLLGQRGGEVAGMLWSEVDLDKARWSLPAPRTKNAKPHMVPLPTTALDILTRRRAALPDDEPRVFPGFSLTSNEHSALESLHGGKYQWKDLRRTVATRLAELGFDETVIGRALNHAKYSITSKHYNTHAYVDEIRLALTAWDKELVRILADKPKSRSRVLPMRRR